MSQADDVVQCLNSAYRLDPAALNTLFSLRVPCNKVLAQHEHIEVGHYAKFTTYRVSALGVLNGVLRAMGLPSVATKWDNNSAVPELLGLEIYKEDTRGKEEESKYSEPCEQLGADGRKANASLGTDDSADITESE